MLLVTLNGAFAAGFFFFAMRALKQGWPFLKHGWLMMQTQTSHEDYRFNVERRRAISEGGRFLIGGILWLVGGVAALIGSLYFSAVAFHMLYGFP